MGQSDTQIMECFLFGKRKFRMEYTVIGNYYKMLNMILNYEKN